MASALAASNNSINESINILRSDEIPITALRDNTLGILSCMLDSRKYIRTDEGYHRDWRGIARLTLGRNYFDETAICFEKPTSRVIREWRKMKPTEATFAKLLNVLKQIDRWDVLDDITEYLVNDAREYKVKKPEINSTSWPPMVNLPPVDAKTDILTIDDSKRMEIGLPPQTYDAFVLHAAIDVRYAIEIKQMLEENGQNNLKLCFKEDVIASSTFEHVALTQLIEERCHCLIVIFTKEFNKSPENKFLVEFTEAVQIRHSQHKIIPLIYDTDVELTRTLKYVTHLLYNSNNYWERLSASVRKTYPLHTSARNTNKTLSDIQNLQNASEKLSSNSEHNKPGKKNTRKLKKYIENLQYTA